MIACESFDMRFAPGTDDPEVLAHLRTCDRCLDVAAQADPDVMFRALGGDMIPPGGVDLFVDEVMQQVRVRDVEQAATPRVVSWPRRLAVAATLVAGISGALLFRGIDTPSPAYDPKPIAIARGISPVSPAKLTTKPVVETYESENATIVEMPSQGDVQIVMIFDENLPADL